MVTITNKILERTADKTFIDNHYNELKQYNDVKGNWAFYDIMEASNAHDYKKDDNKVETWTAIRVK